MTDLSQMIRWNTGFVRGLAQSVLERAKVVRSTLTTYSASEPDHQPVKANAKAKTKRGPAAAGKKPARAKKAAPKARKTGGRSRGKKTLHG